MLIVFLFIIGAGLLAIGYWLRVKYWKVSPEDRKKLEWKDSDGNTCKPGEGWITGGWILVCIMLVLSFIGSGVTTDLCVSLEARYDTYLGYTEEDPTDVLVLTSEDLTDAARLSSQEVAVTLSLDKVMEGINQYNKDLYSRKYWAKNWAVGIVTAKPAERLRPVILRLR